MCNTVCEPELLETTDPCLDLLPLDGGTGGGVPEPATDNGASPARTLLYWVALYGDVVDASKTKFSDDG